jgi:hypothetical protein
MTTLISLHIYLVSIHRKHNYNIDVHIDLLAFFFNSQEAVDYSSPQNAAVKSLVPSNKSIQQESLSGAQVNLSYFSKGLVSNRSTGFSV